MGVGVLIESGLNRLICFKAVTLKFLMVFGVRIYEFLRLFLNKPPEINKRFNDITSDSASWCQTAENGTAAKKWLEVCLIVAWELGADVLRKSCLASNIF